MSRAGLLLGYFLVKVVALLVCHAQGEPREPREQQQLESSLATASAANDSREAEGPGGAPAETVHTEDRCQGYYDVMGQWDAPFVCRTASYLYCCGTCGFRFCCAYKSSRLDQSKCKNYDTPLWMMTGRPPSKKNDRSHDPTRDKTNLIVYIICGVVAIMALVGIFTKLGLEKAHRPHRENMTRALASVMQQQVPGSREHLEQEVIMGSQGQHYENMQACATPNSLRKSVCFSPLLRLVLCVQLNAVFSAVSVSLRRSCRRSLGKSVIGSPRLGREMVESHLVKSGCNAHAPPCYWV
ncbi:hypothetical protein AAFF_G00212640 [Aldrovandia affinis]|uniref:Shisa N-terminal domain-containing protein n=1 Tax=Aldrovandia affinis TaxID=143900 RepID=A0AAD7RH36_9TELE|nr:hypothetical protein AAFF_G00212640 [Aldrovandia affinis]